MITIVVYDPADIPSGYRIAGGGRRRCPRCQGWGKVETQDYFSDLVQCPQCRGWGHITVYDYVRDDP